VAATGQQGAADLAAKRHAMVERQLRARGIADRRLLGAFELIPREDFVRRRDRRRAYADEALSLRGGQTISQPYMVAALIEALELRGPERVLEVGTGSGYSTALLALLAAEVISIERIGELADSARARLAAAGVANAEVIEADGSLGWPAGAPYDAIAIHARVPGEPRSLLGQLRPGGRLIAPIATGLDETLTIFRRLDDDAGPQIQREELSRCRFVPLIGAEGYPEEG